MAWPPQFPSFEYNVTDFTKLDNDNHSIITAVRMDLLNLGVLVVKPYDVDSDTAMSYEDGIKKAFMELRRDGDTPHGSKSGGEHQALRVGSHHEATRARLDDNAKRLLCELYGVTNEEELVCGWDAVAYTRPDTHRQRPPSRHGSNSLEGDTEKACYALTGGKLQGHANLGLDTPGANIAAKMRDIHPACPWPVQAQLVCHSMLKGGSTFVFLPVCGLSRTRSPISTIHFHGRDFCVQGFTGFT